MLRSQSTVWQILKGMENHLNRHPFEKDLAWILKFSQTHFSRPRAAVARWLGTTGTDVWLSVCVWSSSADLVHLRFPKATAVSTTRNSSLKKGAYSTETTGGISPKLYACLRWWLSVLHFVSLNTSLIVDLNFASKILNSEPCRVWPKYNTPLCVFLLTVVCSH